MSTTDSLVGAELGRSYRVIRLLDEGASSLIYEAERLRPPRRKVAVKVMHPVLAGDQETIERFHHEAEILGELQHENVVELIDVGQTDEDLPFHVLELLEGELLRELLDRDGPLPPTEVARLVGKAASALQALHGLKVVHRDVTPRSLFMVENPGEEPQVKLLDFTLALGIRGERKRGQPEVIGSEGYMSPEQFRGEVHEVDAATDVFALGVVAYEALSGRRPFEAEDEDELLRLVCKTDPTPITARVKGLPPLVNRVLARALAKDKGARYDDIEGFARELSAALEGAVVAVPAPEVEEPPVAEASGHDPLDGMTLMDATPPPVVHKRNEEPLEEGTVRSKSEHVEEQAQQDPSVAGQTLLGEDDLLDELFGGEDESTTEAPATEVPDGSASDRHTLVLPGEAPVPVPDTGGDPPKEPPAPDPSLAGQTLVGEDDLLDELADGQSPAKAPDPLDGQTIMDEVMEVDVEEGDEILSTSDSASPPSPDVEEPPPLIPPKAKSQEEGKIVTVFQGDAWARAEEMARKRSRPESDALEVAEFKEDKENSLDIERSSHRVWLVAICTTMVVILVVVLCFMAQ